MLFLNLLLALSTIGNTHYIYSTNALNDHQQSEHVVEVHNRNYYSNPQGNTFRYFFDDLANPQVLKQFVDYAVANVNADFAFDSGVGVAESIILSNGGVVNSLGEFHLYNIESNEYYHRGYILNYSLRLSSVTYTNSITRTYDLYLYPKYSTDTTSPEYIFWTDHQYLKLRYRVIGSDFSIGYTSMSTAISDNIYTLCVDETYKSDKFSPLYHGTHDQYTNSYESGYQDGYSARGNEEWSIGYAQGKAQGQAIGETTGYQSGYAQGLADGRSEDEDIATIFAGFIDVGLLPVNVFLQMFNFEVFGISISGIVSAIITVTLVLIIIRFITGKKE